jgi:predicted AAA+ superfamily ATPase
MYFQRNIEHKLLSQVKKKEIVVLTGMRRTGKTTLLKLIFDRIKSGNKVFLDLENSLEQMIFEEVDYNNILENLKSYGVTSKSKIYLFIDEIQFMPKAVSAVKYLYDHYDIKFFLSGSSSFYLKNLFPQSLAGRKIVFELFPLTFGEFVTFKKKKIKAQNDFSRKAESKNKIEHSRFSKLYDEYLEFGGFPQVVLEEDIERKKLVLKDIFNSYFQIDVLTLSDFKKIDAFKKLIFILLERVGSKLDITKLSSLTGVSRDSVYSYLNLLEGSYFLFLVSPFTKNRDREVSGAKKVFICDTGLLNYLSKVSKGNLLENSIFLNLKQYGNLNYYQNRSGKEIDFVLDEQVALEVKTHGDKSDIRKLEKLSSRIGLADYYLITQNYLNEKDSICAYQI